MFQWIRLKSYCSHGVLLSLLLHGGMVLLLNLKSRVVTLTTGPESGILRATLVVAPADQRSKEQPPRPLEGSKAPKVEQPPLRVEQPPRLAEKIPVKSSKSAKSPPAIVPSKEGTLDQLVKVAEAPPPSLKQPPATSKKMGKVPAVEEKKRIRLPLLPLNSGSKAAPAPPAEAADLDHFFGHLATNVGQDGVRTTSAQQCSQYASQIKNAIQANLIKEPGSQGRGCEIALQLAADGSIVQAQARQGDPRVCAAALRAVRMTARVPKPADLVLYDLFKEITISFEL